jgi:hypothetical protein
MSHADGAALGIERARERARSILDNIDSQPDLVRQFFWQLAWRHAEIRDRLECLREQAQIPKHTPRTKRVLALAREHKTAGQIRQALRAEFPSLTVAAIKKIIKRAREDGFLPPATEGDI